MTDLGNMIASCVLIIMAVVFIADSVHSWHQNDEMIAEMKKYDPLKEAHISQKTIDQQDKDMGLHTMMSDIAVMPLTVDQVETAVDHLDYIKGDFETAHEFEDDLYKTVLKAIKDGKCDDPKACAKAALKSQSIDFPRYCA